MGRGFCRTVRYMFPVTVLKAYPARGLGHPIIQVQNNSPGAGLPPGRALKDTCCVLIYGVAAIPATGLLLGIEQPLQFNIGQCTTEHLNVFHVTGETQATSAFVSADVEIVARRKIVVDGQ